MGLWFFKRQSAQNAVKETDSAKNREAPLLYIDLDLSFIPADKMTPELRAFLHKEVINQSAVDRLETIQLLSNNAEAQKRFKAADKNFHDFTEALRKFAMDEFKANNHHLARQCYLYLIEINKTDTKEKKHLLRIYEGLFQ